MSKQLDVLFIHPGAASEIYQELSKDHSAIETPLWCCLLAQSVRIKGFSVQILDCEVERLNYLTAAKIIDNINPRVAIFVCEGQQPSASSQSLTGAIGLVKELKNVNNKIKTMFVGGHISALPLEILTYNEVDFVGQNESVYCIQDLLSCDNFEDKIILEKVKGLGWKDKDGRMVLNTIGKIVAQEDFPNDLPSAAYDLLPPLSKYRNSGWASWGNNSIKSPFSSIFTSIGCPFKCFVSGTRIILNNKEKKIIENVNIGDKLIAFDESTGKETETKVVKLFRNIEKKCLLEIEFNNQNSVTCTEEHPFYISGQWVEAKNLIVGDKIHSVNENNDLKITKIKTLIVQEPTIVYNFECYPHNNYFVGLSGDSQECILVHNCQFCMINIINRTDNTPGVASDKSAIFRHWKPEDTIKQLDYLANEGVINLRISDEMFELKEDHFLKLCHLMIERKYNFNAWSYSRISTAKAHHFPIMKKAGINFIGLGVESPNKRVRGDVVKGNYEETKIKDTFKWIRDAGIAIGSNWIFGLPEENLESMQETLDFSIEMNTENSNYYCSQAYPGSPLYYIAKDNGWELPQTFSGYSQHAWDTLNLPSKYLSAQEILAFRDKAFMQYFTNSTYLNMLEKKFGKPAREDVEKSTKIKLKRKLLGDPKPVID